MMSQASLSRSIERFMRIDCLVAEIGSTTTVVNAFNLHSGPVEFLGRGMHQTTVDTDVNIGLQNAIDELKKTFELSEKTPLEIILAKAREYASKNKDY